MGQLQALTQLGGGRGPGHVGQQLSNVLNAHFLNAGEFILQRGVLPLVHPLPADAVHPPVGAFAGEDHAGGDLGDDAFDVLLGDAIGQVCKFVASDGPGLVEAVGVGSDKETEITDAVAGVIARIGLFGDARLDEGPVQAAVVREAQRWGVLVGVWGVPGRLGRAGQPSHRVVYR